MPQIIITTDRQGKTNVRTAGVKGAACQQLTAPLEKSLGMKLSDEPTQEMLEEVQTELNIEQS